MDPWIRASPGSPRPLPQIHFWEEQRQNESARVKTLFLPESGVKLKNLTGYTSYWVSVAAFNAAGDGPRSPPVKARTQQAGGARGTAPPAASLPLGSVGRCLHGSAAPGVHSHPAIPSRASLGSPQRVCGVGGTRGWMFKLRLEEDEGLGRRHQEQETHSPAMESLLQQGWGPEGV